MASSNTSRTWPALLIDAEVRSGPGVPPLDCGPLEAASKAQLTIHQIRRRRGPLFSMVRARDTRSPSSIVSVRACIWTSPGPSQQ
jgi:hypothetical protein